MRKRQYAQLALTLIVAMHVHWSLAQTDLTGLEQESQSTRNTLSPTDIKDAKAMTWPMLPGESVTSLAALFYPQDPQLQKRFISKTLQLSQPLQPELTADAVALQANLIIIPELKSLAVPTSRIRPVSKKNRGSVPLQMSYGLKDTAQFMVPEKLQAQYQQLLVHNESLKLQLAKLNTHLEALQQTMATLSKEALRLFSTERQAAQEESKRSESALFKKSLPNTQSRLAMVRQNQPVGKLAQPQAQMPTADTITPLDTQSNSPFNFHYSIWIPLILLALLLAWLARLYAQRKSKQLLLTSTNTFAPIVVMPEEVSSNQQNGIDDVDFSLTQNGLSDSMSVTDLSQYDLLQVGADGELVLEQAKIYVHIGRSEEAIELLQTHIDSKPRASLHHWLYLLDIYRESNQKEAFSLYAALLHERFNVMTPVWSAESIPSDLASTIEAFPHIVQQLTALWTDEGKTIEAQAYIEYLLTDNRDSIRAGFSMEVFQELILLNDILALRDKFDDAGIA